MVFGCDQKDFALEFVGKATADWHQGEVSGISFGDSKYLKMPFPLTSQPKFYPTEVLTRFFFFPVNLEQRYRCKLSMARSSRESGEPTVSTKYQGERRTHSVGQF